MTGHQNLPHLRRTQLSEQRRKVDFDTYDVTVDELLRRVGTGKIDVAPVYQRQFRWDDRRQSSLVESVFLGIPIPPLFMATNQVEDERTRWEVVDGLQRLLTLVRFAGDAAALGAAGLGMGDGLALRDLEKLSSFNRARRLDLPPDMIDVFLDRPLKVVVLNDKSDLQVRYDLFERLNTGGISLTPQEIRECVYRGEFIDMLNELAGQGAFRRVVVLPKQRWKDGTPEDFVLRFFAFCERYESFVHSVREFLGEFTKDAAADPMLNDRRRVFEQTFEYLARCFPEGLRSRRGQTPVNLFEGVSVGARQALRVDSDLPPQVNPSWIQSPELKRFTTGATNSQSRVAGRIHFCRDRFLGR